MLRIDDLENKSVLVTGASAGIGAAPCRRSGKCSRRPHRPVSLAFARQGARVAVHWHSNRAVHSATPPERMEAMRKTVYLGRIGTPADCVGAFLFLASQQLSGYITGQIVHVNGGQVMP
jgi:NAD(P)-dependent dehydrogenase (short-subunit alcohol dehydrogenase family)